MARTEREVKVWRGLVAFCGSVQRVILIPETQRSEKELQALYVQKLVNSMHNAGIKEDRITWALVPFDRLFVQGEMGNYRAVIQVGDILKVDNE